jgi:DNA repair ATPase RecN
MLKLKIKDFQSVGDISFDVDGFTVIVGKNNRGKSAIIRAVDAALNNRSGDDFIRWGKTKSEVSFSKDGLEVDWVKGDSAKYKVNGESFTKLNRSVPQPIIEAGIKKIEVGDTKLSPQIAHQFKELFLLDNPSSITEVLSVIYNLNVLSDADVLCIKDFKKNKSLLKTRESDLVVLKQNIDQYKDLDSIKIKMTELKEISNKVDNLKYEIELLSTFSEQLKAISTSVKILKEASGVKIPETLKIEKDLSESQWLNQIIFSFKELLGSVQSLKKALDVNIPEYAKISEDIEQVKELNNLNEIYSISNKNVDELNKKLLLLKDIDSYLSDLLRIEKDISIYDYIYLSNTSFLNHVNIINKLKPIINDLSTVENFSKTLNQIETQISSVNNIKDVSERFILNLKSVKELQSNLEKITKEFDNVQEEFSKFDSCPLCNKPLDK